MHLYMQLLVGLILAYIIKRIFFTNASQDKQIPGAKPRSKEMGNLEDIRDAGSLHLFLAGLHGTYGKIASFWFGTQQVVSIACPDLIKEQQGTFDRPYLLFQAIEPFIGSKSVQFANKEDGKGRRREYDRAVSHKAMTRYLDDFNAAASEVIGLFCSDMAKGVNQQAICTRMAKLALKINLITMFGNIADESKITEFHKNYGICWSDLEARVGGGLPEPGSEREKKFQTALDGAKRFVKEIVAVRKQLDITEENERLIDILIRYCVDEETLLSDAITYVVGGFHNTANAMAWALYFVAENSAVQDKLYAEVVQHCGVNDEITFTNINKCGYLKQVVNETLRYTVLATFAARYLEEDIKLGGYPIPGGTPIIHALGVVLKNPEYFPDPEKFNPDRFDPGSSCPFPSAAFVPFGVGKRMCPGHRFSKLEVAVCVAAIVRKFEIGLVEGQKIELVYGFVSQPSSEIMITLNHRN